MPEAQLIQRHSMNERGVDLAVRPEDGLAGDPLVGQASDLSGGRVGGNQTIRMELRVCCAELCWPPSAPIIFVWLLVRRSRLVSDWEDVETRANAVLTFTDGSNRVITASFAMLGGVRNSLEVYTTKAVFRSSMTPNNALMAFSPDAEAFGTEYLHEKVEPGRLELRIHRR